MKLIISIALLCMVIFIHDSAANGDKQSRERPTPPCPEGWKVLKANPEKCVRRKNPAILTPCPEGWQESELNPGTCEKAPRTEETNVVDPTPPCPKGWKVSKKNPEKCVAKRPKKNQDDEE
ncbi:uncharacterized protein LOC131892051 [Tigriopus californicus]|uniref:uncharacterized protein LOC131892051 n=1 Tax=Tigriopus californicus TaxID=6832 RepID=UPI0027DA3B73|nr:uncharacterized protein LOC131892051 [Tigriopus californicus]|eukprot:TCALIF_13082-PA protein Name:"Protein of unknown function" AED:0.00 eAED:0.00 QI:148/1/1/1/0.75/0.8/5/115/120